MLERADASVDTCWVAVSAVRFGAALLVTLLLGGVGSASASDAMRECPTADPGAKELARTAETTAETYSTDHNGYYSGLTRHALRRDEPELPLTRGQGRTFYGDAYLVSARAISHGQGYIVRTRAADGDRFAIMRDADGEIARTAWVHGQHCAW